MNRKRLVVLLAALLEMGQAAPPLGSTDPRVQVVPYRPDQTVTLQAAIGYALVVELSEEDRIENVVVGDGSAWQVTANKRGDHLVIKPVAGASATDLVVTTDSRRYIFLLQPTASPDSMPFVVRFDYPQAATVQVATVPVATYRLRGDKSLFPVAISDDGKETTITWDHDTPLPAILASSAHGKEAIVNGRMVDGAYVIEGTAPFYIFRRDKAEARAERRPIEAKR